MCWSVIMAGGGAADVHLSKKFVSETELDERRKKRQEEWEKVRKPDDPEGKTNTPRLYSTTTIPLHIKRTHPHCVCFCFHSSEVPEEEYDPRSLFERLQEQKDKKQEEFEEQFKFSGSFLSLVEWLRVCHQSPLCLVKISEYNLDLLSPVSIALVECTLLHSSIIYNLCRFCSFP